MALLTQFAAAAGGSIIILFVALRTSFATRLVDHPNRANAMHTRPIPRIGGIAIWLTTLLVAVTLDKTLLLKAPLYLAALLAAVSYVDDKVQLSALTRLVLHIICALSICWLFSEKLQINFSVMANNFYIVYALVFVLITWATNLFNFMDGADGLAGGMALFGFGTYAIAASEFLAFSTTAAPIANLSAIIAGAALGFLFFNFSPAKVFMGDAGSIPLGFLAATLGIEGVLNQLWQWWFPLLVFSPFIVDATVTLLRRVARREKIWIAHRQHYYHRLILSGWNHRRVALSYYGFMLMCATSALAIRKVAFPASMLALWVVIYGLLLVFLGRYLQQKDRAKK